jgi:serine protease SohB
VILQGLNYNEIAKRFGVQPMVIKAGKSKARLTKFGEVSRSDLASEQQDLEKTHESFRAFVVRGRPGLANKLDTVADGSVFLGEEALHLGLVDGVMTSRQYIQERVHAGDRVLKLHRVTPRSIDLRQLANPSNWISHARSWASNIGKSDQSGKIAWFLQAGSLVGLARHIFRQYNG